MRGAVVVLCLPGVAQAEKVADCDKIDKLRERALCLLKTDDEAAIARLHALALEMHLTFLALNNNKIESLPEGVFAPLRSLKGRPYLSGNPLPAR